MQSRFPPHASHTMAPDCVVVWDSETKSLVGLVVARGVIVLKLVLVPVFYTVFFSRIPMFWSCL